MLWFYYFDFNAGFQYLAFSFDGEILVGYGDQFFTQKDDF